MQRTVELLCTTLLGKALPRTTLLSKTLLSKALLSRAWPRTTLLIAALLGTTAWAQGEALPVTAEAQALQAPPAEAVTQTPAQAAAQAAWEAKNRPATATTSTNTSRAPQNVAAPTTTTTTMPSAAPAPIAEARHDVGTTGTTAASSTDAPSTEAVVTATDTAPEAALQDVTQQLAVLEKDLSILEEDLLYPPSSRIAVYVSMDVGELFALDEVEVKINGTTVAHHLYTEQQVDALHRGGVQRLYVGNAKQGDNEITAFFLGRGHNKEALRRAATATFAKTFEPAYIELKIIDSEVRQRPELKVEVH